ncbi:MAG: hypothetical protein GXO15_04530 [Crenarchaeota archaeon]|nr:hypothetical protein [Thermoproteota archaeon]
MQDSRLIALAAVLLILGFALGFTAARLHAGTPAPTAGQQPEAPEAAGGGSGSQAGGDILGWARRLGWDRLGSLSLDRSLSIPPAPWPVAVRHVAATAPAVVEPLVLETAVTSTAAPTATVVEVVEVGGAPGVYGSTNVQVEGVDEPDIVENNGTHVFLASGRIVEVYRAWPPSRLELAAVVDVADIVWRLAPPERLVLEAGGERRVIANVTRRVSVWGLMLPERGGLVVLAVDTPSPGLPPLQPRTWILVLDQQLRLRDAWSVEGFPVDARLAGDTVVAVASIWGGFVAPLGYRPGVGVEEWPAVVVGEAPVSTVLAFYRLDGGGHWAVSLAGTGPQAVYVAADGRTYIALSTREGTRLVLVELGEEGPRVAAEAVVPGRLGKQWQLDLYRGVLRVVTIVPEEGWRVDLYTFDADTLEELGSLRNITVREGIHGVRFLGPVLYLVTFRNIDPLFAIDLSDPANPRVLGYLEAPGFDEYLHPIGEEGLLGVGREGVRLRVTLYRLEKAVPRPVARLYLPPEDKPGGAWSPLLDPARGHRAFTMTPAGLLLLPVRVYSEGGHVEGVAVVRVDAAGGRLELLGVLEHRGALRATYIEAYAYTLAPGFDAALRVRAWSLETLEMVGEAPAPLANLTVSQLLAGFGEYLGKPVTVTGVYTGFMRGGGWLLSDPETDETLRVEGASPAVPLVLERPGAPRVYVSVRVLGYPLRGADGSPLLYAVHVETLKWGAG